MADTHPDPIVQLLRDQSEVPNHRGYTTPGWYFYDPPEEEGQPGIWYGPVESSEAAIEAACGPWPGKCITHAPFEGVLYYACRDADALLRLWPILKRMARQVRRGPQEQWRERAA